MWSWLLISLVAFAGFLVCCRSRTLGGRIAAGMCFVGLLFSTVSGIIQTPDQEFAAKECGYYASQGARIGIELKKHNASGKIALLVFEHLKETDEISEFRRILAQFGDCSEISIYTVTLANPQALTGTDRLDAAEFCRVLASITANSSIVSLVGLPRDLREVRKIRNRSGNRIPFIAICEDPVSKRILKENRIDAAVLPKPDAFFNTEPVSDYLKAFNERYYYMEGN